VQNAKVAPLANEVAWWRRTFLHSHSGKSDRRRVRLLAAGLLGLAAVWFVSHANVRLKPVLRAVQSFSTASLRAAVAFVLLQLLFQTARFVVLVPKSLGVRRLHALRVTAQGQLLNVFVPARGGDVYKVFTLCPDGAGANARALGVVAADKAADVSGLASVLLFLGLGPALQWFGMSPAKGAVILVAATLAFLTWVVSAKWRAASLVQRGIALIAHFGAGLAALKQPRVALAAVAFSVAAWLAEATALIALTGGLGVSVSHSQAMFALLALNVGIAVPILPANLGAFEAGVALGLHQAGVPAVFAVAVAVTHHALQLAATVAWGGGATVVDGIARAGMGTAFRVKAQDKLRAVSHYERASERYESDVKRGPLRFMRERERASVLRLLGPLRAGETFLDVGCGGGFYGLEAKRARMRVCAVDAAPGMVEKIAGKVDEAHVTDVETLQFGGRTFNRVVCAGVMDFVVNPDTALENLMRQVGPGGVLVVLAPRRGLRGAYYQLEKRVVGLRINLFTAEWFEAAARKSGFRVTSLELPLPHNLVVRLEPNHIQPGSKPR
jgi:ubiquinone/menaquinone biosynthesis C-methylase UbiE/uncharacterized membrane protein YbhN (UPF0104 family)